MAKGFWLKPSQQSKMGCAEDTEETEDTGHDHHGDTETRRTNEEELTASVEGR